MKSRSHIFALITACVFLFCGCSDYLSLSKASTISNPQTEYDTALKEYLASLETPLSTIEIKHGEDTPIVWEDTGMEAAVRLLPAPVELPGGHHQPQRCLESQHADYYRTNHV